jgi:predicted site-specific integrase-resolvase
MSIVEIPLSDVGLLNLQDVAARLQCSLSAVQKWTAAGLLPVVVAGSGPKRTFLVREKDLKNFKRPPRGRPKE